MSHGTVLNELFYWAFLGACVIAFGKVAAKGSAFFKYS